MDKLTFFKIAGILFAVVSLFAVIVTVYDKLAAKRHKRRIPENTLLGIGILGGAVSMYITMKIIHHKTLHKKFMTGLPLIILLQAVALTAVSFYFFR